MQGTFAHAVAGDGAGSAPYAPAGRDVPDVAFFAINLDRSTDRWTSLTERFAGMPWPLYRVAALDAANNAEAVLAARRLTLSLQPAGVGWNVLRQRVFSLVEEACFASHMLALKAFLDTSHGYGLILEDDAVPQPGWNEALTRLLRSGVAFDIVKFEGTAHRGSRPVVSVADLGPAMLVRSLRPSSGGAGYLVTRTSAARLLDRAEQLLVPVDDYISNPGLHGCDVMHLSPWQIVQARQGSTMQSLRRPLRHQKRRDPYHFLSQGLRRSTLRIKLWAWALRGLPLGRLRLAPWFAGKLLQNARLPAGMGSA